MTFCTNFIIFVFTFDVISFLLQYRGVDVNMIVDQIIFRWIVHTDRN